MPVVFSTWKVHARDRLDYWREEASRAYVEHDFESRVGRNFRGVIRAGSIGPLGLSVFDCNACLVLHTGRCVKRSADDSLIISVQSTGGTLVHQDGRDTRTNTGDLYLIDPRRPFSLEVMPNSSTLAAIVPRRELEARLGNVSGLTALPVCGRGPIASLASGFLAMLTRHADGPATLAMTRSAQHALDLLALAMRAELSEGPLAVSSPRAVALLRLKGTIEERLRQPTLRPENAAAASGLSVRYANALLAEEGTSLERYITSRRLERCRRELMAPEHASRTVSSIAYSWGFSDVAHFTRRFKVRFGHSPGECRPDKAKRRGR